MSSNQQPGADVAVTSNNFGARAALVDATAPTVVRFTPADGAIEVAKAANVVLSFSEAIQRGAGLITLKTAANTVVETFDIANSSKVTISGATLTINPTLDLLNNTQYYVTFPAGVVKDAAGNRYAGTSTYDFKTVVGDITPPTITRFTPVDGAVEVAKTSNITFTFNETIRRGDGLITLKTAAGAVVETFDAATSNRVTLSGGNLILNPTADLLNNTQYQVSVSAGAIKDVAGNAFAGTNTYDFKTVVGDIVPPSLVRFSPADGAVNVAVGANIVLGFNENIKRGEGSILLKTAAGAVVETFNVANSSNITVSGSSLTINPTVNLDNYTQYYVSFDAGAIKDMAGNSFSGANTYDFKTIQEKIAPTVVSFLPIDGAINVDTNANIALNFSEAIARGIGKITLKTANGTIKETFDIATSNKITISGNTLTIDPSVDLANNTQYYVTLAAGTVKDLAGNNFAGITTYDFKTAAVVGPDPISQFNVNINYTGDEIYRNYFLDAESFWEKVIVGDLPDVNSVDDVSINATVKTIDGLGKILGQAGPNGLRGNSYLPYSGTMTFDSADMASMASKGTLLDVIIHEMGHVLGFGTIWPYLGLNTTFGQYTGVNALAEYRTMFNQPTATYVPLETGGGSGTANAHWSEAILGREVMTGYAQQGDMPLSRLTVAAMKDLGYVVNMNAAEAFVPALTAALTGIRSALTSDDQNSTLVL